MEKRKEKEESRHKIRGKTFFSLRQIESAAYLIFHGKTRSDKECRKSFFRRRPIHQFKGLNLSLGDRKYPRLSSSSCFFPRALRCQSKHNGGATNTNKHHTAKPKLGQPAFPFLFRAPSSPYIFGSISTQLNLSFLSKLLKEKKEETSSSKKP